MKHEFDNYIEDYRKNNDQALWLSGETSAFFAQYKAEKIKEWLPNLHHKKILDFGCGDGLMIHLVHNLFDDVEVYGIDPSQESIYRAQQSYPKLHFKCNDQHSTVIDFDNNQFDCIFSAGTFHHISFHLHLDYVKELYRILKPNGTLIIFELNPLNPLTVFTLKRNPIDKNAQILTPWYTFLLLKNFGKPCIKFICFFPKIIRWLRVTEPLLVKVPLGALYAALITK